MSGISPNRAQVGHYGRRCLGVRTTRKLTIAVLAAALAITGFTNASAADAGPRPQAPTEAERLVFADEFDGGLANWDTCYAWWPLGSKGCTNEGNPDEEQWYVPSAVTTDGAAVTLTARRNPVTGTFRGTPKVFPYTSGMIQSRRRFSFTYGYAEFRMRLAPGQAMWDAAWLLPVNYNHRGEIDVAEAYGQYPRGLALTYHAADGTRYRREMDTGTDLTTGWHTFGIDWEPSRLTWYVDGKAVYMSTATTPAEPMYLLANLAVAGRFDSPATPAASASTMALDYVRVWQK